MCKIAAFTNSSKLNIKKASEAIGNILLKQEKDGFGYAVQGEKNVFGEKCIAPWFQNRLSTQDLVKYPIIDVRQSKFGHADKPVGPAIFHGRTCTNDKGLRNCHPMQKNNWHLIHNGVVTDYGPDYERATTNDSEHVLHRLILGIDHVQNALTGYYAFAAIDDKGLLHIARDGIASLYVAYCPKLESHLFGTTVALIEEIADTLKFNIGPIDRVSDDTYMIFDKDELVHTQKINSRGFEEYHAQWAQESIGRSLHTGNKGEWDGYGASDATLVPESIIDAIEEANERAPDDKAEIEEIMRELDNMDASYNITNESGERISTYEFYKLDFMAQACCRIVRGDGTVVDSETLFQNIA